MGNRWRWDLAFFRLVTELMEAFSEVPPDWEASVGKFRVVNCVPAVAREKVLTPVWETGVVRLIKSPPVPQTGGGYFFPFFSDLTTLIKFFLVLF